MIAAGLLVSALFGLGSFPSAAQNLKIGLAQDPDSLDPVLSRSFAGRIVMAAFCDKLFDINRKLEIVPQLATSWSWSADGKALTIGLRDGVLFQDGEKFDAAAVKFNIERDMDLPGSNRRSELPPLDGIDIVDPLTVRIRLGAPFAPLLGVLTDRAGMMLSPKAASAPGADMGRHPVCAGPFRLVERVQQDRIVVERFDQYWNKEHVKLDRITYLPMPDSSVRLANLKSGDLDLIDQVRPTDVPAIETNPNLATASVPELGYAGITVNLDNGPRAKTPLGSDVRVRRALEAAINRDAINSVVFAGKEIADDQPVPPDSPYYNSALKPQLQDLAKAKALLAAAGVPHPQITLLFTADPEEQQAGEMIQAMAGEAGFDIHLQAIEFASGLAAEQRGDFEAALARWSGRIDPDGNTYTFLHSGAALNDGHYANPEVDRLLDQARLVEQPAERKKLYDRITEITAEDLPIIYLYHRSWIWGFSKNLQGFSPVPDGLIRVIDLGKS
jgi:peptide/nickel transport system substrate-binding protein